MLILFVSSPIFSQFGYKQKLDSAKNGIEISYKVVRSKKFDKNSPLELRFKFKNTNDFDLSVHFKIEYRKGFTERKTSSPYALCLKKHQSKYGRVHGLAFEIDSKNIKVFENDEMEWEFINFYVIPIDFKCKVKNVYEDYGDTNIKSIKSDLFL